MRRTTLCSMVALALLAAPVMGGCGVSDRTVASLTLDDARITIVQADGMRHTLTLDKRGAVTFDGVAFATVTRNGRLRIGDQDVMQVAKDGTILVRGQVSNISLDRGDGFVENGAVALTVNEAGAIEGALWAELDHPKFTGDGATVTYQGPVASRRTLMFALAAFLTAASIPAKS